jgi:hypothetical protein
MRELSPEEWEAKSPVPDIELSEEDYAVGVYLAAGNTEAGRDALRKLFCAGLATDGSDALLHVENLDKALDALEGVFVLVRRYERAFYGPAT